MTSKVTDWILIETNLFAQMLRVQRLAFDVARIEDQLPKLWQSLELQRNRELHVMSWDSFVIRNRFIPDH